MCTTKTYVQQMEINPKELSILDHFQNDWIHPVFDELSSSIKSLWLLFPEMYAVDTNIITSQQH